MEAGGKNPVGGLYVKDASVECKVTWTFEPHPAGTPTTNILSSGPANTPANTLTEQTKLVHLLIRILLPAGYRSVKVPSSVVKGLRFLVGLPFPNHSPFMETHKNFDSLSSAKPRTG